MKMSRRNFKNDHKTLRVSCAKQQHLIKQSPPSNDTNTTEIMTPLVNTSTFHINFYREHVLEYSLTLSVTFSSFSHSRYF